MKKKETEYPAGPAIPEEPEASLEVSSMTEEQIAERLRANEAEIKRLEGIVAGFSGGYQQLDAEYRQGVTSLESEEAELEQEKAAILAGTNPQQEEDKRNVLSRQREEASAAGQQELADAKAAELASFKNQIEKRSARLEQIGARVIRIADEKTRIAKTVWDKNVLMLPRENRERLSAYLDWLEAQVNGEKRFCDEHGIGFTSGYLVYQVRVSHSGPDRPLRARIEEWI